MIGVIFLILRANHVTLLSSCIKLRIIRRWSPGTVVAAPIRSVTTLAQLQPRVMAAPIDKRSAAEARRLKLLSRGRNRMQQITQGQSQGAVQVTTETAQAPAPHSQPTPCIELSDRVLSRSQSLPHAPTHSTDVSFSDQSVPPHTPSDQQPMSPPPNSLWDTPRASDR